MELTQKRTPAAAVVTISGDVDLHSSPELRSVLRQFVEEKTKRIIVDLGNVSYMDSSGVATLIECLQGLRAYKGELRLGNVPRNVRAVFALAQLEKLFTIDATVEDALKK